VESWLIPNLIRGDSLFYVWRNYANLLWIGAFGTDGLPFWHPNWDGIMNVDNDNFYFDQWLDELAEELGPETLEWHYEEEEE